MTLKEFRNKCRKEEVKNTKFHYVYKEETFIGISPTDIHKQIIEFVNKNNVEIIDVLSHEIAAYITASLLYREELK